METPALCFFDVDHTITQHSTGKYFAFKAVKAGYIQPRALMSIPLFYLKYRLGEITDRDLEREFSAFGGVRRDTLEELAERVFTRKIAGDIFPGARSLIESFQDRGIEVVIATSSLDLVIKPLACFLGIKTVLASSLEYNNGICTGRFRGKLYFGENKRREALDFLESRGIQPEHCAFYSDSIHDLPLLEAVGESVVVNPDLRLRRYAKKNGWKIIRFR